MKVSLIIPAYNVENLIEMTLKSVQNQTLKQFECIIVNDYSQDSTEKVVRDFIKKDKRFKLINHRANAGLSAARNTGLRFAKGKYIAFLDSDDLIMPDSLELRAKTLDINTDSSVIGTYAGSVTIDMNCAVPPQAEDINLKMVDFITAGGNCPFNANQPMFVKELFKKIGGFNHSLNQAEDYDMWMRVLRYGFKIIPTNKQLVTYRQTEGSMIRNNPLLHLEVSYKRFIDCYEQYSEYRFNDKIKTKLAEGLQSYKAQLDIANRVLEFIGLGLAKGEDIELLYKKLDHYLPNYFEIIESHRPFADRIKKGIDRYFKKNVNFNNEAYKELKAKVDTLYKL
ncbi:MAG: glycosyltransferase family 2 protein, partial [Campylobacterales bacterium]|nr:glycosyltransferase family 2 protein [Campylobacterales bacterium]